MPVYDSSDVRRPFVDETRTLWTRRSLIRLLVARELTVRYKRSVLGVWWTLLNPILTAAVMWLVFSQIFNRGPSNVPFIVYLLSGILLVQTFFAQGVLAAGNSLIASKSILAKIRVPGEVFAFTSAMAAMVNFGIGLLIVAVVMLLTGTAIPWTVVLLPLVALAMLLLVTGVGMIIASAAVHFYDIIDFVRVLIQLAIWLVPTFYPIEIIPERWVWVVKINPLYSYLVIFRGFLYEGQFAPAWNFAMMIGSALIFVVIGIWLFSKSWRAMVVKL